MHTSSDVYPQWNINWLTASKARTAVALPRRPHSGGCFPRGRRSCRLLLLQPAMPSSRVLSPAGPSTSGTSPCCELRNPPPRHHPCLETLAWRECNSTACSCADRRNESVGPLGGWTLGSTTLSLAHFLLEECQKLACRSVANVTCPSARQALSGDTVSTHQTQRLRCVAGSACSIEIASTCVACGCPTTSLRHCRSRAVIRSLQAFRSSTDTDAMQASAGPVCCCSIAACTGVLCSAPVLRIYCQNSTSLRCGYSLSCPRAVSAGFAFDTAADDNSVPCLR